MMKKVLIIGSSKLPTPAVLGGAVPHNEFKQISLEKLQTLFNPNTPQQQRVLLDVKGLYPVKKLQKLKLNFWRL